MTFTKNLPPPHTCQLRRLLRDIPSGKAKPAYPTGVEIRLPLSKLTNPTLSYSDQPYTCLKKSNYGKRLAGWTPKEIILLLQDPVLSEDDLINICPNESPLINPFQKTTHIPTPNFS